MYGMKELLRFCICVLGCAMCSSCMTIRWVETAPQVLDARAKSFSVSPDSASIYVVCLEGWWVFGRFFAVFLDGANVGILDDGKYRLLIVTPGKHSVGEGWQGGVEQSVDLTTEAGNNYYVRITQKGGRGIIETIGEEEGRNLVRKSKLAGQWRNIAGEERLER